MSRHTERFVGCSLIDDIVCKLYADDRRQSASDNRQFANLWLLALFSLLGLGTRASVLENRCVAADLRYCDLRDCVATEGAVPVEYAARKAAVAQLVEQLIRNQ